MKKVFIVFLLIFFSFNSLFADDITFTANKTDISFAGDEKRVELKDSAEINTSDIKIVAENMKISGEDFSKIECTDNVNIIDYKHNISIFSTSLNYNRKTENIIVDGWVEMQDLNNKVALSAAWMEFDMNAGLLKLQIRAKIIKDTSRGAMICRADSILFNRETNTLLLTGNSTIAWNGDDYKAENISVDLESETIKLIGNISGTISK